MAVSQEKKDILCAAPFVQMLLTPSGRVTPCCHLYGLSVANLKDHDLNEAWNTPALANLRKEFLQGKPKTCAKKIAAMGCNKEFEHFKQGITPTPIQEKPPVRLDIRLNSFCNLKCKMCDVWQGPNGFYDTNGFWEEAESELFPFLEEIDILGGEPFIQKDTFRLLESIPSVNPRCRFNFITNGSYPLSRKIKNALEGINLGKVQLSLDSFQQSTYAAIRREGDFALVMATAEFFEELHRKQRSTSKAFELKYSMCVLQDNWQEIPEFISNCRAREVTPVLQYAYYDPSHSHLHALTPHRKLAILQHLAKHVPQGEQHLLQPITTPLLQGKGVANVATRKGIDLENLFS